MNRTAILAQHLEKLAYVYLRQSTLSQVRHHQESTERQYALRDQALQLGWPPERIIVLDQDLGISGTQMANRPDFQRLMLEVSLQKVGAVFALEASRLARSCLDWHRLVDLCYWTKTLLIDGDGCYNPADFNDGLLLGLKGTMAQAELHFLHGRLQGGKLNKAQKGQLRFPLPVGLVHTEPEGTVLDPDQQVQGAVRLVLQSFRQTGSGYGVIQYFTEHQLLFPKRSYGGVWNGQLRWGRLTHGRVLSILRNPAYAGAYVFGRYRGSKIVSPSGPMRSKVKAMPMTDWQVLIRDHHPAYLTWEEFLENQQLLEQNQTQSQARGLPSAAREGLALLQGLLVCGKCGRRLAPRYLDGSKVYPLYECNWRRRELGDEGCFSVQATLLDAAVTQQVLTALQPAQLEIALAALAQVNQSQQALDHQWQLKIQRADYEAQLAQRRFEEVDPANRLVAATLESRWEQTLAQLGQVRQEYEQQRQKKTPPLSAEQQAQVRQLAEDLPRLWQAPTTSPKDRKRILRLLIQDITVEKLAEPKRALLHVRWQGGACEDLVVPLPLKAADRWRYPEALVAEVRRLAATQGDAQIAADFNQAGRLSAKGKPFRASIIKEIRFQHRILAPLQKRPGELTVKEVSARFGVSQHVVYYWLDKELLAVRRLHPLAPIWITLTPEKEQELVTWVARSTRIPRGKVKES